jgi:hypothetical protein
MQPVLQGKCNNYYTTWVCVFVALGFSMQCAWAILSSVACPALQSFFTLSHKGHDFRKKKLLNIKYVFWFSLKFSFEIFLILRRNERDTIKMCIGLHVQYPLSLSDFNETSSRQIFEKSSNITFYAIRPVGAELFHVDGRTDRHDEANCRFSQFCERVKKTFSFY